MPLTQSELQELQQLKAGIAPLSPEEQAQLAQLSASVPQDPTFTPEPESSLGLENRLSEVGGILSLIGQAANPMIMTNPALRQDVDRSVMGLGQLGLGVAETAAKSALMPGTAMVPTSPRQQMVAEAVTEEAQFAPGMPRFDEDQTRFLSSVAGMLPMGPKGTMLSKALRFGQMGDPLVAAGRGLGAATRGMERSLPTVNRIMAEVFGVTTGAGGERGRTMIEAGKKGERDIARAAIREQDTPFRLGEDVIQGENQRLTGLSDVKNEALEAAGDIDVSGLKQELVGDIAQDGAGGILGEMGIGVVRDPTRGNILVNEGPTSTRIRLQLPAGFRTGQDTAPIVRAITDILEGPDTIPATQLDEMKKVVDDIPIPKGGRRLGQAMGEIRGGMRDRLSGVEGFDAASDNIRDFFRKTDDEGKAVSGVEPTAERLKLPGLIDEARNPRNRQQTGESLATSFNKGPGLPDRLAAVDEINEAVPGTRTRAAGFGFSGFTPNEIIGRNQFFQALGPILGLGVVGGAATAGGALAALAALPAVSVAFVPRFAGQSLLRLGQAEAGAQRFTALARQMVEQGNALGINARGLTLGQLADRLDERAQNSDSNILTRVGDAAQR